MSEDRVPLQVNRAWLQRGATVPREIAEAAYAEYHRKYKTQTFERLHERGGFEVLELMYLLLDRIRRIEAETACQRCDQQRTIHR